MKVPLLIHLGSILVRPTHVSLRVSYELLHSKELLTLEASTDGKSWDRLDLEVMPLEMKISKVNLLGAIRVALHNGDTPRIRSNLVVDVAEAYLRKSWQVEATSNYYSWFRFTSRNGGPTPLAGVALEIFGDIHEE